MKFDTQINFILSMWEYVAAIIPNIVIGFVIFAVFWIVARIIGGIIRRITRMDFVDTVEEKQAILLIQKIVRYTIIIIGLVTALSTAGVDITAMVAGLGLTGFALGFALKDAVSNFISGALILFYRPFKTGSMIEVGKHKGEVTRIDLRYTTLETEDEIILVPNSAMFSGTVVLKK